MDSFNGAVNSNTVKIAGVVGLLTIVAFVLVFLNSKKAKKNTKLLLNQPRLV